jgi:glycosyltransferase involved in cell wall biosynthesis
LKILILSAIPWWFLWQRPQQIASRLADRGHTVVYFQTPIYLAPLTLIENHRRKNMFIVKKTKKNLRIVNLFLPHFLGKLRFVTEKIGLISFKVYLKFLGFKPDDAIFYYSSARYDAFLLDALRSRGTGILYDCMDEFSGFPWAPNTSKVLESERNLIESSVNIAASRILYEKISRINPNCAYVPNGADFEHFHRATKITERPTETKHLRNPIIGFIGAIYDWIDIDLICELAELHQDYSILIVGPVKFGLEKLEKHSNIVMVGSKKYDILPQYLSCMDVCLIPFKINKLTLASNPIKMYEYLAAGKPVVSTALPEVCNNASEFVYVGKNREDFIRKVEEAVEEPKKPDYEAIVAGRVRFAQDNSWEKRVDVFEKLLRQTLQSH